MARDPPLPFEPLRGAEVGELEFLESEEHAGEAMDDLGVAAGMRWRFAEASSRVTVICARRNVSTTAECTRSTGTLNVR
jgi:hypothetical protein